MLQMHNNISTKATPAWARGASREAGNPSGWDRYLTALEGARVPDAQRRWYVERARAFIAAVQPTRMGEVSAEQITGFFTRCAREHRLSGWQFRQLVDALHILLVGLARNKSALTLDWDYWRTAGEGLSADHPTVAAAQHAEAAVEQRSSFTKAGEQWPVLKQMARVMRARGYAIRTEQTYLDWCHRFMTFCKDKPSAAWQPSDLSAFLTHLAVDRQVSASTQSQALNGLVPYICRMRSRGSRRMRRGSGSGSTCFRARRCRATRRAVRYAGIT
jgi:hypothetical protein